jgi:MOSC domain-containing protein YiiM
VEQVAVRAGLGLVGDRFYGKGVSFDGHITFSAWEVIQGLMRELPASAETSARLRRNVVVEGVNLNQLIGQEFCLAGIPMRGVKHCAPCHWMEYMVAPGALAWLRGRGGLRAQALGDGILYTGATSLSTAIPLDLTTITQPLPMPRLP